MLHHGKGLLRLTRDPGLVEALKSDPDGAPLEPRARAAVNYALKLTRTPWAVVESDLAALRGAGLSDAGILDTAQVTAYFAFVNRIASGLGVEVEPWNRVTDDPAAGQGEQMHG